jgi:2'-5' RNA ligase
MEHKRVFLGINLPENLKEKLTDLQNKLKKTGADVRWVEPENFHFCLKFFGSQSLSKIEKIKAAIKEVLKGQNEFLIRVETLGAFPTENSIRVIWSGATKGTEELVKLAKELDSAFEKIGIEKEKRPFTPHITLGRARSEEGKNFLKEAIQFNKHFIIGVFELNELVLFESKLSPKGPKYSKLEKFQVRT